MRILHICDDWLNNKAKSIRVMATVTELGMWAGSALHSSYPYPYIQGAHPVSLEPRNFVGLSKNLQYTVNFAVLEQSPGEVPNYLALSVSFITDGESDDQSRNIRCDHVDD